MKLTWRVGRARRPFAQFAVLVIVGAFVFTACGSSTPTTTTSSTQPKKHQPPPKAIASCTTPLLNVSANFGGSAAGGSYYRFEAKNAGPSKCSLDGYPTLAFFAPSAGGGAGSTTPVQLTVTDAGPAPTTIDLAPGASAEFLMIFTDVPVNGGGCSTVASVNVTPPHASGSTPVPISFSPCGGIVKVYAFGPTGSENP